MKNDVRTNQVNTISDVNEVIELWAEELPDQLNHAGAPLSTLSTGTSTFSTFSSITCS